MRVLMIEDDLDTAGNVGDFLAAAGHQVDFAYDGISGMHLALTREFDAIIVDWMLPGMPGTDLCRKLRHSPMAPPLDRERGRVRGASSQHGAQRRKRRHLRLPPGSPRPREARGTGCSNLRRCSNFG